ncbi:hypothetical protein [Nocardioides marmotae]|uniref:DUF2510 domain-containing protein n=1 Tax=Nocardioides marmotae TaxID=2663857 RepID=A0A6I3JGI4_9ACTN|nr:hypothetical protein [Nocardioides marmotae]MCR6033746.1 hypothetical protein [Gordonia jinghuaiqii]MBC9735084.1 hypothetical protein [Nocardioides marmotae]MTB86184.1 hypothetical protein [Nocardioides marmotae]MTB97404.1 hypothetical protein [Nocardioides marmotae]QKE01739.1 hypothetical protein HPC71_12155 [Nocardioides marmotae]
MPRTTTLARPGTPDLLTTRPATGDYRWDGKRWRRWTGRRWASAAYSADLAALHRPDRFDLGRRITESQRKRVLDLAVERQVLDEGASVVHAGPHGTVLAYQRSVSHAAHAVFTILTGGLWGLVWLVCAIGRSEDRALLECDDWGHVWALRATSR